MGQEEIDEYEAEAIAMAKAKIDVEKAWDTYDHYQDGMRIIDTDYDTYMLLYHCREEYPEQDDNDYRYERALETHDALSGSEAFFNFKQAIN